MLEMLGENFIPPKGVEIKKDDSERDLVEEKLKETFGDQIQPTEKMGKEIDQFKDGNFAMSEMGMFLYANGYNLRGVSNENPNGMVYFDGENIFGVGYFRKEDETDGGHLMIVAPHGSNYVKAVEDFISRARAAGIAESSIYVRHLSEDQLAEMMATTDMHGIEADPWHPHATEEDETYPNRIYHLSDIMEINDNGELEVKKLESDKKGRRGHNEGNFTRFNNFLDRNNIKFALVPYGYTEKEKDIAESIVKKHFGVLQRNEKAVGSTPEDYFSIIRQRPSAYKENEKDYFAYLGKVFLEDGKEVPVSFFAGESIGDGKMANYASISLEKDNLSKELNLDTSDEEAIQGMTGVKTFVYINVFARLMKNGVREVHGGGSEVESLDTGKRRMGGKTECTYWVVKK